MNQDERTIRRDRMRFIKNTSSSRLCYLAILLDVLYFVSICKSDVGTYYYNMQEFNRMFTIDSIGVILLAVLLFITNTHKRRRYYIGNYVATGLFTAGAIAISVFGHNYIQIFKQQFLQVDFAALKEHAETWGTLYTESTFWFDIHDLVFGLLLCVAALLVCNAIWKMRLINAEAALVEEGRRKTA